MSFKDVYAEVGVKQAPKQAKLIDKVLSDAPALALVPTYKTTDGFQHVYEVVLSADSMKVVNQDEALPLVDANTDLRRTQIGVMGGKILVPEDKANAFGGPERYFAGKMPMVMKQTGKNMEIGVFIKTLLPAIKAHAASDGDNNHEDHLDFFKKAPGGVADNVAGEWLMCIKWEEGVLSGLYNPDGFGDKMMFNFKKISNGSLYTFGKDAGPMEGVEGYGMRMKSNFGILIADGDNMSGMYGIDLTESVTDGVTKYAGLPTVANLQNMIHLVEGSGNNTAFYCSPRVFTALQAAHGTYMGSVQYTNPVTNVTLAFATIDGVPFVTSYNFSKVKYDDIAVG